MFLWPSIIATFFFSTVSVGFWICHTMHGIPRGSSSLNEWHFRPDLFIRNKNYIAQRLIRFWSIAKPKNSQAGRQCVFSRFYFIIHQENSYRFFPSHWATLRLQVVLLACKNEMIPQKSTFQIQGCSYQTCKWFLSCRVKSLNLQVARKRESNVNFKRQYLGDETEVR